MISKEVKNEFAVRNTYDIWKTDIGEPKEEIAYYISNLKGGYLHKNGEVHQSMYDGKEYHFFRIKEEADSFLADWLSKGE